MRIENPYATEYPASPDEFAGRKEEVDAFRKALEDTIKSDPPSPVNMAFVGGFGIGKTSLLEKFNKISADNEAFIIKITLTPGKCRSMESFCYDMIDKIHKNAWDSRNLSAKVKEGVSKWKIDSINLGFVSAKVKEKRLQPSPITILERGLSELWHKHLKSIPVAVIMYDDLHYLAESSPEGLYDLRGIFQDLRSEGCRYLLVVSGTEELFETIRGVSEPLMRFFDHFELKPFTYEETMDALYLPLKGKNLKFEDDVVRKIQNITHGHPYFIKFIAHDLFEYQSEGIIDTALFNSVYPKIFDHLAASRFIKDYRIASENERVVLLELAKYGEIVPLQNIRGVVSNVEACISRLEDKGLITKQERGRYSLYHPLFKEYLKQVKQ